jgi:predicted transcriptional regulator
MKAELIFKEKKILSSLENDELAIAAYLQLIRSCSMIFGN